jgi:hypothetical protein
MAELRSYAQRRLSPFMGTVQVLDVGDARALTYDGLVWQIQLRAQIAVTTPVWGGIGKGQTGRPFFRYGSWTTDGELRRLPINPMLGDVSGYPALADVLAALSDKPSLPFPLCDRYECWVVDSEGLPVVLFASACDESARTVSQYPRWQASSTEDPLFQSAALEASGHAADKPHATWITEQLTQRVGTPLSLLWIHRGDDGTGVSIDGKHIRAAWTRQHFQAADFPPMMLTETWQDPLTTAVVQDYLAWQSPYLLMLASLDATQRRALEIQACRRPRQLLNVRRLFPMVMDQMLIDSTLVQARLEQINTDVP